MKKLILLFAIILSSLYGATAFNLDGIKNWDVLIINKAKELKPYKKEMLDAMVDTTKELGVKLDKTSPNTLLIKIQPIALGKATGYLLELNIAEFLKRTGLKKETFALSYSDNKIVKTEDVEDMLVDSVQAMLDKFSSEYEKDNNHKGRIENINHSNFAKKMGYFEDFNKAIAKANRKKKYVMVVVDAVSCPWCRKLEENILSVKNIDKVIKSKYIPVTVDVDKSKEPKMLKKIKSTPIIYIVDPRDSSIKAKFVGYPNCKNFIEATMNESKKLK